MMKSEKGGFWNRVARFFLVKHTKIVKVYITNDHKIYQMAIQFNK
jgi:hypothetical protein